MNTLIGDNVTARVNFHVTSASLQVSGNIDLSVIQRVGYRRVVIREELERLVDDKIISKVRLDLMEKTWKP